jgi:ADP-heptose:LPS heptosyltransferase
VGGSTKWRIGIPIHSRCAWDYRHCGSCEERDSIIRSLSLSLFPTGHWKFALFARLTGARTRIGFAYPHSRLPARVQQFSAPLNPQAHDTDQNCDLVEALVGGSVASRGASTPRLLRFPFAPCHPQQQALRRERYFICHPGSSAERGMKEKRLSPETFAFVARKIHHEFGLKCILAGGLEEESLRRQIASAAPEAMLPYTSGNFPELAALIHHARFYLGNDSGLMHIAAALGKRCIAFFGPSNEKRTGPYSDGLRHGRRGPHFVIRRDGMTCSPCWTLHTIGTDPPCIYGDTRCLKDFQAEPAWSKVRQALLAMKDDMSDTSSTGHCAVSMPRQKN